MFITTMNIINTFLTELGGETLISEVVLKGFQSHVNTTFNLQNGLNVITGPSDAGKTAIIRAIRWVAFNEPQGEAFVNENVGEAGVTILLQNGSIITKHRRKGKTSYTIQESENGIESTFEKSEVPLEVTRLLGIEKHSFGDFETALNFSFQLDAPFLISETASAGAKVLGKLAGTESVDLAIKGVSKDTHATRNMRSQAEKDMERIIGSLFEYEHIDDAKQAVETAEILFEQVEASHTNLENLKEYRNSFLLFKEKRDKLSEKMKKLRNVPQLTENITDIEKSQQRHEQLLQLQDDGNRLRTHISSLEQELLTYSDIPLATDLVSSITFDRDRFTNLNTLRQLYQKHTQDVKVADETLNKTKELSTASEDIKSIELDTKAKDEMLSLKSEYENTSSNLNGLTSRLDTFKDMHETDSILTSVESDEKRLAALRELYREFNIAFTSTDSAIDGEAKTSNEVQKAELELQQAWDEAGGVCPLCESTIGGCEHES